MVDREKLKELGKKLGKNKYVLAVLALGLILILWPSGKESDVQDTAQTQDQGPAFSVENEEARLEAVLSRISGAGKVMVRLSLAGTVEKELAEDENGALVISGKNGEEAVELRYLYPEYQGAVVVCSGADIASVRLAVIEAVSNYTGLKTNRITVMKMSN